MRSLPGVVGAGRDLGCPGVAESDLPLTAMDEAVMPAAEQVGVVEVGGSAVGPVPDVVVVSPGAGYGAAGEDAADVAEQDRFAGGDGEGTHGSADVDDVGGSV